MGAHTNILNRYENNTGMFTVLPSGEGLYYFSTYLTSDELEYSDFFLTVNNQTVCVALGDDNSGAFNIGGQMFCSAVVYAYEGDVKMFVFNCIQFKNYFKKPRIRIIRISVVGDEVKVMYAVGIDNSPLWNIPYYHNGFNGFRL